MVDDSVFYSGAHEVELMENHLHEKGKFMV